MTPTPYSQTSNLYRGVNSYRMMMAVPPVLSASRTVGSRVVLQTISSRHKHTRSRIPSGPHKEYYLHTCTYLLYQLEYRVHRCDTPRLQMPCHPRLTARANKRINLPRHGTFRMLPAHAYICMLMAHGSRLRPRHTIRGSSLHIHLPWVRVSHI